jgi:phosphinothricin acetyltransferase
MTAAPQTDDLRGWLTDGLPFVITTDPTSGVVGWAKVFPYADRCAFEGIGEHAVYVDPEARGRGVGRALLEGLIDAAGRDGLRKLTARISLPTRRAWPFTMQPDSSA